MELSFLDDEFNASEQLPASVGPFRLNADRLYELAEPAKASDVLHAARVMRRLPYYRGQRIDSIKSLGEMICTEAGYDTAERCGIALCDGQRRLIAVETLNRGTRGVVGYLDQELARRAYIHNANALYLWHTHPTSAPVAQQPSDQDLRSFKMTRENLERHYSVFVVDSLVIAAGEIVISMAEVLEAQEAKDSEARRNAPPSRPWRDAFWHFRASLYLLRHAVSRSIAPQGFGPLRGGTSNNTGGT